ncbi:MAG TPA: MFS transporter [Candidatus Limnocylindrales bacterium]|nr:MFS transporter [Candidatus Limnocylindrales bacterium]
MTRPAAPPGTLGGVGAFVRRQQRDWIVTVIRTSLDRLAYQMVFPYLSVYIVALGASATQLGLVNGLGLVAAGLVSPFIGWLIDRHGPRSFYLAGIGLLAVSYLAYAAAGTWLMAIGAMIAYWLGYSISGHSCATICGNCLVNRDRATAMMVCETVGAGFVGIVGPVLAAVIVASSGTVDPDAIRPLFLIGFLITVLTFFIVLTQLSPQRWSGGQRRGALFGDLREVLRGPGRGRWLAIAAVGQLPVGMVFAFSQVYAHEVKGADAVVLGAMAAATALVSIVLAIPLGRLADRIGRKRVLFITTPLFCLSNLVLIWAPAPAFLVVAGGLQAFFYLGGPVQAAMERELVPAAQMGRWIGVARVVRLLLGAVMALVAGLIWDGIGPAWVFVAYVVIELAIRVPLLATMSDTLGIAHHPAGPPAAA